MRISYQWLKKWLPGLPDPETTSTLLTGCGLEVESAEVNEVLPAGLVVGEVLTVVQHPNADRLRCTTVNIGGESPLAIVCGAPNVAAGQKVIVATVGTTCRPTAGEPFTIQKSKIRGEVSEGMICAEDEIGLGKGHDGILVLPADTPVGLSAADYFQMPGDVVYEIGLTANRGDATSHRGVAIDLSAITGAPLAALPAVALPHEGLSFSASIDAPEACGAYALLHVEAITVKPSSAKLQNALLSIGAKPINNVVDITNFILHHIGQPMHAFDAGHLTKHGVQVRFAKTGETMVALDQTACTLDDTDLIIASGDQPLALAGVMGGLASSVTSATTSIVLESAWFQPVSVRKSARRHGFYTDSSFRFERGTDPDMVLPALSMAASLIQEECGGQVKGMFHAAPASPSPTEITFKLHTLDRLVGQPIPLQRVREIVTALEIKIQHETADTWELLVPARKSDVTRPADIVEEVLRIYGLNAIEEPKQTLTIFDRGDADVPASMQQRISQHLASASFFETIHNSMVSLSQLREPDQAVALSNPLSSEMAFMRQTLLHGGLKSIAYNRNRKRHALRLFEWGNVYYRRQESFTEKGRLGLWWCGPAFEGGWMGTQSAQDIFRVRTDIEMLMQAIGAPSFQWENEAEAQPTGWWQKTYTLSLQKKPVGWVGYVEPKWLKAADIDVPVVYAEFDADALFSVLTKRQIKFHAPSRFPNVRRDLSLLIPDEIAFSSIEACARKAERKMLKQVIAADVYKGPQTGEGFKSYTIGLVLEDENQTLTDQQIEKAIARVIQALESELGAKVRQ